MQTATQSGNITNGEGITLPDELQKGFQTIDALVQAALKAGLFENIQAAIETNNSINAIKNFIIQKHIKH